MIYNNSRLNLDLKNQVTQFNMSPCPIKEIIFFCKHWTGICKQLFTFRKSAFLKIGLCPKVIIWMAFYGAVAGCTLEKKYEHDNTRTMNLIRNFLQFLLFYKWESYQRENTNWKAYQLESVVGKSKLMLESPDAFGKFEVGDIDVDVNLVKNVGDEMCWWQLYYLSDGFGAIFKRCHQHQKLFTKFWSPTSLSPWRKDIFIEVG